MAHNLTAADRSALIRLASTLPKGSEERRVILAGLMEANATKDILTNVVDCLDHAYALARTRKAPRSLQTPLKQWLSQSENLLYEANKTIESESESASHAFDARAFGEGLQRYVSRRYPLSFHRLSVNDLSKGRWPRGIQFHLLFGMNYRERPGWDEAKLEKVVEAYCKSQGLTPNGWHQWLTPEGMPVTVSWAAD